MMTMTEAEHCGLTEQEAKWVGHPAGTPLPNLPPGALRLLATEYRDEELSRDVYAYYYQCYGGWSGVMFAIARLNALWRLMGEEAFGAAMAEMEAKWTRICVAADAEERGLAPCSGCGRSRKLPNAKRELCGHCANEKWRREHPTAEPAFSDFGDDDIPF